MSANGDEDGMIAIVKQLYVTFAGFYLVCLYVVNSFIPVYLCMLIALFQQNA
jgi:hypothetical protein